MSRLGHSAAVSSSVVSGVILTALGTVASIVSGVSGLATVVLVVLKALDKISWDWVWVLSPLWSAAALDGAVFLVFIVFTTSLFGALKDSRPVLPGSALGSSKRVDQRFFGGW